MKDVPSVTMKAGTLSFEMMTPLTKPTAAAPPTPAANPTTTEGNSGNPPLNDPRIARAERTEARLITQPTDRSMPAVMMTKVWPRPSSSTGTMATRMFWELRTVRKLTEPPVDSGTATTKNRTIRPRNTQAQMRLKKIAARWAGVSTPEAATSPPLAVRMARSVKARMPSFRDDGPAARPLHRPSGGPPPPPFGRSPSPASQGRISSPACGSLAGEGDHAKHGGGGSRRAHGRIHVSPSLAGNLIDEAGDRRVLHVLLVDDGEAGFDPVWQAGDAGGVGGREHHRHIPHVERLLRQHQADDALVHQLDRLFGRVVGDHLDVAAESGIDNRRSGASGAEHVGAEDAGEVGLARQNCRGLLRRLILVVQIEVGSQNLNVGEVLRHHLLEALRAALDRADVRVGRVDVDGPLAADRLSETARRDAAAFDVVRADVADRELHRAIDVVAVSQERVDSDDLDAVVDGGLKRPHHL